MVMGTPCSKDRAPSAVSTTSAMRSVRRSATTTGAVFAMEAPRDSCSSSDLNTSPSLPGVTLITNPDRNTSMLSPTGTSRPIRRR